MDLAPTLKQAPEENQLTECVAWIVSRSPAFARAFCGQFLAERERGENALARATQFAAETFVTLPHPVGKGVLFPDLLVCGDARSFELLVEVKAGSTPHSYPDGDALLLQPDMYAKAWRALPAASQADQLFVGTLTNNFPFPDSADPIRAGDVTWEQLRDLLSGTLDRNEFDDDVRLIASDLFDVIEERILTAVGELPPHAGALLSSAKPLIDAVSLRLAADLPAGKARQPARIERDYTGRYVEFIAPEGVTFELWLFVTVAGGQYNLHALGDVAVARVTSVGMPDDPARLLSAGFQRRRTLSGWTDWRIWLPLDHTHGEIRDRDAFEDALVGAIVTALRQADPALVKTDVRIAT
jgi:hypothetical protein